MLVNGILVGGVCSCFIDRIRTSSILKDADMIEILRIDCGGKQVEKLIPGIFNTEFVRGS